MSEEKKIIELKEDELKKVTGGNFTGDGTNYSITSGTRFWYNSYHTEYYEARESKSFNVNDRGVVSCNHFYCAENNPDDIHSQLPQTNATYQKIIDCVNNYGLID